MAQFIKEDVFGTEVKNLIDNAVMSAANPIIEKALEDVDKILDEARNKIAVVSKEEVAKKLIALIQMDMNIVRNGSDLQIVLKQALPEKKK